jgi:2-polyprenyl-3-methyl-5-hydroxy-6-metoxy-1,4-benzoquinol methylase
MELDVKDVNGGDTELSCPICHSNKISLYLEKNGCLIRQCGKCGFVFVRPLPQNTENFYAESYFYKNGKTADNSGYTDYEKDKMSMEGVFYSYLAELEKFTKAKKIFDVGAATGYFLDLAKLKGWQTGGNEISSYAAQVAQNKGHNVVTGDLTKADIAPGSYDAVTMWDVLGHVWDPQENLNKVNKILVSGGILAINTIDRGSLWARLCGKKWLMLVPPEHLHYFNASDLKILLSRAGFDVVEIKKIGKKYSVPYIIKTLALWHGGSFWEAVLRRVSAPIWRKISIPINLRDNIFVIARKKN